LDVIFSSQKGQSKVFGSTLVSLQVVMNIIMPATIQRRAFALRRHIIGPEERFVAMLALNF
jgi:hypothetical protein